MAPPSVGDYGGIHAHDSNGVGSILLTIGLGGVGVGIESETRTPHAAGDSGAFIAGYSGGPVKKSGWSETR